MYKVITYYQEDPAAIVSYRVACRYYWAEHINYSRNLIISVLGNLSDVPAITDRLMKNQEDIGDLLRPYYSAETVDEFVSLLKAHAVAALNFINAAKAGNNLTQYREDWQANSKEVIALLNKINSTNWPELLISPVWNLHVDLTIKEIQSRIAGDWVEDIAAYDQLHRCIIDFSEAFASGVVNQNLDSFCK